MSVENVSYLRQMAWADSESWDEYVSEEKGCAVGLPASLVNYSTLMCEGSVVQSGEIKSSPSTLYSLIDSPASPSSLSSSLTQWVHFGVRNGSWVVGYIPEDEIRPLSPDSLPEPQAHTSSHHHRSLRANASNHTLENVTFPPTPHPIYPAPSPYPTTSPVPSPFAHLITADAWLVRGGKPYLPSFLTHSGVTDVSHRDTFQFTSHERLTVVGYDSEGRFLTLQVNTMQSLCLLSYHHPHPSFHRCSGMKG